MDNQPSVSKIPNSIKPIIKTNSNLSNLIRNHLRIHCIMCSTQQRRITTSEYKTR